MNAAALVAFALLAAAPAPKKAAPKAAPLAPIRPAADAAGAPSPTVPAPRREARAIPLDETQARTFHAITTHPNIPAIIEFPERWIGQPTCGDCIDPSTAPPSQPVDALFAVQFNPEQQQIVVKPAQYARSDGGAIPNREFLTTLTVKLAESKMTLTLRLEYGTLDTADPRVVFTLPGRSNETAYVQQKLREAKERIEVEVAERVALGVNDELRRLFLQPHDCRPSDQRHRNENILVEVKELCRFGARRILRFTVENRHQSLFNIGSIDLRHGAQPIADTGFAFEGDHRAVKHKQVLTGVITFDVETEGAPAERFELRITEDGGRNRNVVVSGLSF